MKTSVKPSIEGDFSYADAFKHFTLSKLFARGVILRSGVSLLYILHLYIRTSVYVYSWQMASVGHLYPCLFTTTVVSNVFSVAFRKCVDDSFPTFERRYVFISVLRKYNLFSKKFSK